MGKGKVKATNLTIKEINKLVALFGGEGNVQKLLKADGVSVRLAPNLSKDYFFFGLFNVVPEPGPFSCEEKFQPNDKLCLKEGFMDIFVKEIPVPENNNLICLKPFKEKPIKQLIAELGGETAVEISLVDVFCFMDAVLTKRELLPHQELNFEYMNCNHFFVRGIDGQLHHLTAEYFISYSHCYWLLDFDEEGRTFDDDVLVLNQKILPYLFPENLV